ncbi:benzoate/H(+) symporter BenE family transporter [Comamonas badia]|uniref:benzoate/H(+) symporter BenE family transporter n=1 Tax=Comamonas badia TaxID=265291 RepID=UPI00040555FE|nr:benzoate/H(+) symporter BenE family transporter [Comamonas badia]
MLSMEAPAQAAPRWAALRRDAGVTYAVNGLIGFIFAATGPVAVILSVGLRGGLSEADLASWIFGAFFLNGLITLLMSWRYRQPLAFFWTIPGTVLVGPALGHLSFPEVIGAFFATGVLMLLLGVSGWVRRAMAAVPMPIVMGMVAGVFLRFGTDLVRALHQDVPIAAPMVITFLLLSAWPRLGRRLPPMLGALLVGAVAVMFSARFAPELNASMVLARPHLYAPAWSLQAMVELVLPLAITVLVVQNGQGVAVLKVAGHEAPVNAVTLACGLGSMVSAFVGTVSTCLTGPTNAIIVSSGEQRRHYTGALVVGLLAMAFGLLSPLFTRLMLATPPAFIATLAGLAMLRVLQTAFVASFAGRFSLGALVAFLVTVTDLTILNIGAAFWGLVAGVLVSLLLERPDFAALRRPGG